MLAFLRPLAPSSLQSLAIHSPLPPKKGWCPLCLNPYPTALEYFLPQWNLMHTTNIKIFLIHNWHSCSRFMCTYSRILELLSLAKNFELSIAFLLTSSTPKNLYSCRQSGLSFTSYRFTNTKFKMADLISAEEKVCLCY